MTDEPALLAAVLANPADDLPRLVYADWLEEQGQRVWAEFIRHQIWSPVSPCRSAPLTALVPLGPFIAPLQPHQYTRSVSGIGGATVTYPNGMEFWFRRGFVAGVRCGTETLFGGPCRRCEGTGSVSASPYSVSEPCPVCHGIPGYRTPGIVAELFRAAPVTEVRLTDREPARTTVPGREVWLWFRGGDGSACLPEPLYDALAGRTGRIAAEFDTRDLALAALSRAACQLARDRAGLAVLPARAAG